MELDNIEACCERSGSILLTKKQIKLAINELRVIPFFHPLISITNGKVQGVEVLARISDPVFGILSPENFLPNAERFDITLPFTLALMEEVIPVIDKLFSSFEKRADDFLICFNVPPNILSYQELLIACQHFIERMPDYIRLVLELTERQKFSLGDIEQKKYSCVESCGRSVMVRRFWYRLFRFSLTEDRGVRWNKDSSRIRQCKRVPYQHNASSEYH